MRIKIGLLGAIFIVLLVAAIWGKTSFLHVVLFPFYVAGWLLGCCFGIAIFVIVSILLVFLIHWIVNKS